MAQNGNQRRDRSQDATNSAMDMTLAGAAAATLGLALMDAEAVARESQQRSNVPNSVQTEREHSTASDHSTKLAKEPSTTNLDHDGHSGGNVAVEAEAEHATTAGAVEREAQATDLAHSVDEMKHSQSQDNALVTPGIDTASQALPASTLTQIQHVLSNTSEALAVNLQSAMSHVSSLAGNLLQGIEERLESALSFEPLTEFALTDVTSQFEHVLSGNPAALMLEGALQDPSGAQIDSVFHSAFGSINDFAPEIVSTVEGSVPLPSLNFVGQPLPSVEAQTHPDHGLLNGFV